MEVFNKQTINLPPNLTVISIDIVLIYFIKGCLELDPEKRFTINECLQHRAFRLNGESRLQSRKSKYE